jgi:hypothetical protein
MSNAERQKIYRKRHGEALKEKEKLRHRIRRRNLTEEALKEIREQSRIRNSRYRTKKRAENQPTEISPYLTKNAETRAVNRVLTDINKSIPHSPRKRAYVKNVVGERLLGTSTSADKSRASPLPVDVLEKVEKFYLCDEISQMFPGQRDFIKINSQCVQKVIFILH